MRHSKRTIHSIAIVGRSVPSIPMARFTEVGVTASEEGLRAAQMALPGDVLVSMFLAVELATANLLDGAALAQEVFLLG